MRLLLAEDEKELSKALVAALKHNNYSVDAVYDGEDALEYGLADNYDGIILDIMMPKKSGLEVLQSLREHGVQTPILFLTARSEIDDRILGLDTGADDYLTKPFDMGELMARLRAMTRRREAAVTSNILSFGDVTLNRTTFELCGPDKCYRLANKEFQMMEMLMSAPNVPVSTEQFIERVWGYDTEVEVNIVWVYISYLRKKLSASGSKIEIRSARGSGYVLEVGDD